QPTGMTIDSASGQISWKTGTGAPDKVSFQIQAIDGKGGSASQAVRFEICKPPKAWDSGMVMCM
ncbi:MAG: hypothetical protein FIA97_19880, partial [Methylococcaceae bacterium]|nr:hypothetical protein [Methylococcaceae bacterium]